MEHPLLLVIGGLGCGRVAVGLWAEQDHCMHDVDRACDGVYPHCSLHVIEFIYCRMECHLPQVAAGLGCRCAGRWFV